MSGLSTFSRARRHGRASRDVPDEQPVVGGDEGVVIAADADRAPQEPVRRVQRVRVVRTHEPQPGPLAPTDEHAAPVDADVTPRDLVVVRG